MDLERVTRIARRFAKPYRIVDGAKFRLKDHDPGDTGDLDDEDKPRATEALEVGKQALAQMQDMLYAQDRWSVLLVFQAMDAAGKDGAIKHVMSGINPQGSRPRSSITISCGAACGRCPSGAGSASSTAATTRRCWW